MKVREICARPARACGPETNLAYAAWLMWDEDCGAIPVVDGADRPVGMITDRDICIAVATRPLLASGIRVGDVMNGEVHWCGLDEDVRGALRTMEEKGVRRLPVVDEKGKLAGVLSISDVILSAREKTRNGAIGWADLMPALDALSRPRKPKERATPARRVLVASS